MPNKSRKNNQERATRVDAQQKKRWLMSVGSE